MYFLYWYLQFLHYFCTWLLFELIIVLLYADYWKFWDMGLEDATVFCSGSPLFFDKEGGKRVVKLGEVFIESLGVL